ncbi:MAG: hypothetical protein ACLGGX_01110 [Bdellovibrionia bacterium]
MNLKHWVYFGALVFLFSGCMSAPPPKENPRHELDTEPDNNKIPREANINSAEMSGCQSEFGYVPEGGGFNAYRYSAVPKGKSCTSEFRRCKNGKLTGSYQFLSCIESADITVPSEAFTSPAPSN